MRVTDSHELLLKSQSHSLFPDAEFSICRIWHWNYVMFWVTELVFFPHIDKSNANGRNGKFEPIKCKQTTNTPLGNSYGNWESRKVNMNRWDNTQLNHIVFFVWINSSDGLKIDIRSIVMDSNMLTTGARYVPCENGISFNGPTKTQDSQSAKLIKRVHMCTWWRLWIALAFPLRQKVIGARRKKAPPGECVVARWYFSLE